MDPEAEARQATIDQTISVYQGLRAAQGFRPAVALAITLRTYVNENQSADLTAAVTHALLGRYDHDQRTQPAVLAAVAAAATDHATAAGADVPGAGVPADHPADAHPPAVPVSRARSGADQPPVPPQGGIPGGGGTHRPQVPAAGPIAAVAHSGPSTDAGSRPGSPVPTPDAARGVSVTGRARGGLRDSWSALLRFGRTSRSAGNERHDPRDA